MTKIIITSGLIELQHIFQDQKLIKIFPLIIIPFHFSKGLLRQTLLISENSSTLLNDILFIWVKNLKMAISFDSSGRNFSAVFISHRGKKHLNKIYRGIVCYNTLLRIDLMQYFTSHFQKYLITGRNTYDSPIHELSQKSYYNKSKCTFVEIYSHVFSIYTLYIYIYITHIYTLYI